MRERPSGITDTDVLAAVRDHWDDSATTVEHLPIGFGAHHWRVDGLFVTLDPLGRRHTRTTLEDTYAAAAALAAQGLEFVLASVPARGGTFTVAFGEAGALSATSASWWTQATHTRARATTCSSSSTWSGASTRSRSTPPGSQTPTATPRTTGSRSAGCSPS